MEPERSSSGPDVSIVIPCHRAVFVLPLQLHALSVQEGAPPFEVILADNGENDGLAALVHAWRERLPLLRVIEAAEAGTAYARNRGAACASGSRLLFCDADDVALPGWVAAGVRVLAELEMFSGAAVPLQEHVFERGYEAVLAAVGPSAEVAPAYRLAGSERYPVLMGATFGYRRELFERLGGFDASFGAPAEDNDLAFRTQAAGVPVMDAGQVRLAYRVRSDDASTLGRSFRGGIAHARLCARHDAWGRSPSYHRQLWQEPARALVAAAMGLLRSEPVEWRGRLGTALGLIAGKARYRLFAPPDARIGRGLSCDHDPA